MYSNHWRWYLDEMFGWLPDDAGETEILIGQAQTVGMVCKSLGISEQSYYRWRREYGVLKLDQASPLKVRCHRIPLKKSASEAGRFVVRSAGSKGPTPLTQPGRPASG